MATAMLGILALILIFAILFAFALQAAFNEIELLKKKKIVNDIQRVTVDLSEKHVELFKKIAKSRKVKYSIVLQEILTDYACDVEQIGNFINELSKRLKKK